MLPININKSNEEIYKQLKNLREELFGKSYKETFKTIHELDLIYQGNKFYDLNINGIIINLGTDKQSIPLIAYAIKRIRSLGGNKFCFDIGNGFLSIADIKSGNKHETSFLLTDKIYRQARLFFNRVLDTNNQPSAATNSGNILEEFARYYEAILLYDKALKFNSNFGMALGNKAISLIFYYRSAIKKNLDVLFEALELLRHALREENTLENGGQKAIDYFKHNLSPLEIFLSNKKRKIISNKNEPSPYQVFCSSKNIYLNFCFNCYKCKNGYIDNIFPPFIEKIRNTSGKERLEYHSFSKRMYYSIKMLDQILEDYATSRSAYFSAIANNYNEIDKDTEYYSVLDYCKNSVKYGYLKTAYIKLYNILDKIAHLTFYNYEIEHDEIYFKSLICASIKELILKSNNRGLLALHDLARDFEINGIYNHHKIIRNYLTHQYIDIKIDMFSGTNKQNELNENHHITETLLIDYLDELFQIVKAALLYFGHALKKDYDEATENGNKRLLPLYISKQREIFE